MGKKRMNLVLTPRDHSILEDKRWEQFENVLEEIYKKPQSIYHFWRRIKERTNLALDELILVAERMPNRYMREAFDYEKLKMLLQKIATKPQISEKRRKKDEKPEYVKDEALFNFCMSVVRDMTIHARNLVKEEILHMTRRKAPLFLSPDEQAILTTIFYGTSPKQKQIKPK